MKTALVTGASGFIGSALIAELLKHDTAVYAVVRKENIHKCPFKDHPLVHIVCCDMDNISALPGLVSEHMGVFYHLAWASVSGPGRADIRLQLQNVQWTADALRTAKELGCKRFLCAGSVTEYEAMAAAYSQGCRPGAGYIYGGGKVAAHIMCASAASQLGVDLVWPMITNAYGPGERSPRLVCSTIQKCLRGESPQFTSGSQNYDFVYVDDVVRALRLIGEKGKAFHEYMIGSSQARPLKEFLLEMQAAIATGIEFRFGDIPFTGVDLPLEWFDCSQTEADTGFRAEVSFAEGCRRTMEWWQQEEVQ